MKMMVYRDMYTHTQDREETKVSNTKTLHKLGNRSRDVSVSSDAVKPDDLSLSP